jgi:alanine dehydrogenase
MRIGAVAEIKPDERRVAIVPGLVRTLNAAGHEVLVERGVGCGAGLPDEAYLEAGAEIASVGEVWDRSDLLLKVKEPLPEEFRYLRPELTLFTYLHLAPNRPLTEALVRSGVTAIAYETVEDAAGRLPLLAPMSDIAGRLAAQAGAFYLQQPLGGPGVLIGGTPGVRPARVLVLGGGVVGTSAARVAIGMGGEVVVLERSVERLRELEERFGPTARVLMSDPASVEEHLVQADLVIGAVLISGSLAPTLVDREMLSLLRPNAVLVDVAIDQGGCFETSRPTTHSDPVFAVDGVLHYCVANMPGAVPWTSTRALTNATAPYVLRLAEDVDGALAADRGLAAGLNVRAGEIVSEPVASAMATTQRETARL